jgi:hypothetical protein
VPAFTNVPIRTEQLMIELSDEEVALFDAVKLQIYGEDDGAAMRDLLFSWWEERYLAGTAAGAPSIGER